MNRQAATKSDADRGTLSGVGDDPCLQLGVAADTTRPGTTSYPQLDAPAGVPLDALIDVETDLSDDLLSVLKATHALARWGRVMSPIELCRMMDELIPVFERIQSQAMAMRFMCEEVWNLASDVAGGRREAELAAHRGR